MLHRLVAALSIAAGLALLGGCSVHSSFGIGTSQEGSGVAAKEVREVGQFERVESLGSIDVVIRAGEESRVSISGDDNLLEFVVTEVSRGTLEVRLENGSYEFGEPLVVTISVPQLESLELNGSGSATITGLKQESITLSVLGSGDVRASGSVDLLHASVKGSGDLSLRELKARSAVASVLGSGDIALHAEEYLKASVQGSGDIDYWGSPADCDVESLGSGSVNPR